MRLSDLAAGFPELKILRDGEFNSTGSNDSRHDENILSYIIAKKYIKGLGGCISCVITTKELVDNIPGNIAVAVSEKPKETFFKVHNSLEKKFAPPEKKTVIGKGCMISPKAVISDTNVVIGDNVVIEDFAIVKSNTIISDGCILRSGTIIGGEGFSFVDIDGVSTFVKHYGSTILHDYVEIQYNTVIDKAIWKNDISSIGCFTKLDNLIHVAHGVKIGANCKMASGVIIGGNTIIGDNVFLGTSSTLKNHIKIGSCVTIGMGSVVFYDVDDDQTVFGNPARCLM